MSQKRGQYIFTINGIKYEELISEHYSPQKTKIDEDLVINYEENEEVTELPINKSHTMYTFYDINKNKIQMWVTMVDFIDQKYLPLITDKPCWWCGYSFKSCPLGLPIRYYPHSSSGQTSDVVEKFLKTRNLPVDTNNFFETEGLFCSFPCCKAFIMDQPFNSRYKKSTTLLSLLYYKLYGKCVFIPKADSWKLLEKWTGPLTIEQYRSSFGKFIYQVTPNIKRPFMFTTGTYIEEIKTT